MLRKFIERPVLATVVSIMLVILGGVGLSKLPIQMFPDIAPPTVQVRAFYPGANAETILRSVIPPLEEAINGVEDMAYMSSSATNDGSLVISVYFKLGTNADQAAVNVQNRVSSATGLLPPEVVQAGITTKKTQNGLIMGVNLFAEDEKVFDKTFIANYATINILPEIQRIPGVGEARIIGASKDYSMRVWLKPAQMTAYHITPAEVATAIQKHNLEAAPGRFGESSKVAFEYVINYKGKLNEPGDYENMVVRTNTDGSLLRLKDIARVELGAYTYGTFNTLTGRNPDFTNKPAITIQVLQLPNSNAREIQIKVEDLMQKASKTFPTGLRQQIIWYSKDLLDQSIEQVLHTLVEAFVLVFIVVFLFLQDFRSTLIPAIAVPVALIGTFFFMSMFGFSINLLTLFALVLAIGIVVDDAIVVVEAVHAKMEHKKLDAKSATLSAMHEITPAIIAITLIMAAVFLPVGFMEGSAGVFYKQFAFTLAIAIFISAVNALTLSPALAALFLKNVHHDGDPVKKTTFKQRFFAGFNTGFERATNKYVKGLKWLIQHKAAAISGLVLIVVISVALVRHTRTGFIPSEDQNFAAVSITLPPGSSQERTQQVMKQVNDRLLPMKVIKSFTQISGLNIFTNATSPSSAVAFMVPKKDRGDMGDLNEIMADMRRRVADIKGATIIVFTMPTVPGFGNVDGLDFALQDRTGGKLDHFSSVSQKFLAELNKRPEIALAYTAFRADYPQLEMVIDKEKAALLRVDVDAVVKTMQAYYGSQQVSDFNRFGKYYRVMLQAEKADRSTPASIANITVKSDNGEMVPISSVLSLKPVLGPETVTRYNLYNSIPMNANPKAGYSTGDAIRAVEQVAAKTLPQGYSYEFSGVTREEIISGGQSVYIFLLSLVFVYFLLAAQYNSYILPFSVLLSIPTGVIGVFAAIGIAGIENNIYVQVALIMLIGLLAKNAILIVEFAVQRRHAGETLITAAIEAAKARLRPIIMTSIAFVAGILPMMRATGPSAAGNHSISVGAAGGMITGVVLGVFIIPVLFVIFQFLHEKVSSKRTMESDDAHHSHEHALLTETAKN
ncbi:efflux RND transporter permease subunit [Mucilaginibacter sp. SMC90]|uniref:efflux RND transporter permease subunit n=1 Tax=Mucilaginibacter sp. SMC90 TaxID=2929803 RepID=UPI001FB3AE62|nr:efflux RND transporter permease subunit [Mucilaginibacter sp. SMC90]UOE49366.1 efflux RND transporter permease subunit [Mucilaginibacter sp. SMC90]